MSNSALAQSTYTPALDGWRAQPICLVILHHPQVQNAIPILRANAANPTNRGELSRLSICSRLLDSGIGHSICA
jgi:hypothetical protein